MHERTCTDEAARLRTDLDQFLRAAGHDLAEPARTILGFLDLLERRHGTALPADAQDYVAFARDAAERLEAMLAALLELGRIGRLQPARDTVDLAAVARAAMAGLQSSLDEAAATVQIEALPVIRGDARLWRRLFRLLLENAFTYRGNTPLLVRISAQEATIRIADNGIGIDPAFFDRVLEPFQRLHPRDVIPGVGMGLTIARRIAEQQGGELRLEAGEGGGLVVVIALAIEPARR